MDLLEKRHYKNQKKQAQSELEKLLPSTPPRVRDAIFPQSGRRRPRVLLGRGSHGRVWQVSIPSGAQGANHNDVNLPHAVAVKELGLETKELEATAKRELAVLRALCSSSNSNCCTSLVRCWGAVTDPARNLVAVALELATEGSLRNWLYRWKDEQQQQEEEEEQESTTPNSRSCLLDSCVARPISGAYLSVVAALAAHIVSGLKVLHAAGYCHGDLTPNNVLVLPWETTVGNSAPSRSLSDVSSSSAAAAPQPLDFHQVRYPQPIFLEALPGGPWRFVLSDFGLAAPTSTGATNINTDTNTKSTTFTSTSAATISNTSGSIGSGCSGTTTPTAPPLGTAATAAATSTVVPCGASRYCSPEAHASGRSGACPGDMWSLGVVLWEAAAFGHPFDSSHKPYDSNPSNNSSNSNSDSSELNSSDSSSRGSKAALASAGSRASVDNSDTASTRASLQEPAPSAASAALPAPPEPRTAVRNDCEDQSPFAGGGSRSPSKPSNGVATSDNYWAISEAMEAISASSQRYHELAVAARHRSNEKMIQAKSDQSRTHSKISEDGVSSESPLSEEGKEEDDELEVVFWKFVANCLAFRAEQRPTVDCAAITPFVLAGSVEILK